MTELEQVAGGYDFKKTVVSDIGGYTGIGAGALAGGFTGAALGAIAGPGGMVAGAKVGAAVGGYLGEKLGSYVAERSFGYWAMSKIPYPANMICRIRVWETFKKDSQSCL